MIGRARDRQRGNSLLLAMIVMSALGTLGTLTVVSVQGSLKASTNDRSQAVAMFAAESGAAVAMVMLRARYNETTFWSGLVSKNNDPLVPVAAGNLPDNLPGNEIQPEPGGNLLSPDQNAWYSVVILNNRDDPQFNADAPPPPGNDSDAQVIIRSTGHGPQGSLAIIELEVRRFPAPRWPPEGHPEGAPLPDRPAPAPPGQPAPMTDPMSDPPQVPPPPDPPRPRGLIIMSWRVVL